MRLVFRILAVALIIVMGFLKGPFFSLGVLMGALIVDVNLSIFHYVVRKSDPANPGSPIWVTILKFYLLFAGTALYVFLCIFLHIGEPLGFLVGILCFLPALILTFLWAFINYLRGRARRSKDGAA
ncbi:MAG: ATP synthase subunit I [Deltaproteobacteria bacterium]|nr:ATP synthase subunit I [Deltaproteobacteria bacterium]